MPSPKLNFLPLKAIGDSASLQSREGMAKCCCVRGVICPMQLLDSRGRRRRGLSKAILCDAIDGLSVGVMIINWCCGGRRKSSYGRVVWYRHWNCLCVYLATAQKKFQHEPFSPYVDFVPGFQ